MEGPRERPFAEGLSRGVRTGRLLLLGGTVLDTRSLHPRSVLAEHALEVVRRREPGLGTLDLDLGTVFAEADASGEAVLLRRANLLELCVGQLTAVFEQAHRRGPTVLVALLIRPATGTVPELQIGEGAGCTDTAPQQEEQKRTHATSLHFRVFHESFFIIT